MKGKFAELILWKADIDFEEVLKQNGIFENSDLEEPCDRFENLYKTVEKDKELERDVADGFEKLYKTVEKDQELELYAAMTVKYINSMILNLNDIILKNSDVGELVEELVEELVDKTVEKGKELERDVAEGFEKLYKTVEKDEELELDDGGEAFEKEHFVSEKKQEVVIDKLDKKTVSEDIDSESEMNIPKRNEKCEVADDEYVTLIVNDLPVTARKDIDSKTTLCHYCQQNRLPQPQYAVTLWNPYEDEWRLFKARFTLNGKRVVGSGSTIKKAEHAAARKYLNNNFMSREISLQAEIFFFI